MFLPKEFVLIAILAEFLLSGGTALAAGTATATPQGQNLVEPTGKPCACDKTEKELRAKLQRAEKTHGANSLPVAFSLDDLARVYVAEQKPQEALKLLTRAASSKRKLLPPDDNNLAYTLGLLASAYHRMGDAANYQKNSQEALRIFESNSKTSRKIQLEALDIMADLYILDRKMDAAARAYEASLPIAVQRYGIDNVQVAARHETLGTLYRQPATVEKSLTHLQSAIAVRSKLSKGANGGDMQLLWDKQSIASCLIMQKKYNKAVDYLIAETGQVPPTDKKARKYWRQNLITYIEALERIGQHDQSLRLAQFTQRVLPE